MASEILIDVILTFQAFPSLQFLVECKHLELVFLCFVDMLGLRRVKMDEIPILQQRTELMV